MKVLSIIMVALTMSACSSMYYPPEPPKAEWWQNEGNRHLTIQNQYTVSVGVGLAITAGGQTRYHGHKK